ncbi:hypothetical protein OAI_21500 [Vibrio cyclitrophicus FF160]|uniref:hypothetical protein n=1 Tax=Vibrio cyclitrophicus TaxID=47951 RepID=UPI00031A8F7D|nr:hypothetical protein [Vibrio cyclitrophicus]OEE84121.1 hypothetical protein OAI_21500 [Vibrio cyclitrophicus FF160]PMJ18160.1 hypothetical protein BCU28_19840 [Vibrio cyclitrophicus]PMO10485.1 hypothetical protein BCT18_18260 [Vibrio cyclitrophicus]
MSWIVFSLKGRDHILEHLDAKTLKNSLIEVRECSRQEFAAEEIQEFFDRMEKAQERMKKVLRGIAG